jgi:metal-dependent amidase/aminoacylase/carboxypeptidase family protein
MNNLVALRHKLYASDRRKVNCISLYQTAEETGEGALKAISEHGFDDLGYAFALRNLSGYGLNSIFSKKELLLPHRK